MMRHPEDDRLRAVAVSYVKDRLEHGKTLSSLLLETIDLQRGRFSAQVPDGYSYQQTLELEKGHLIPAGRPRRITVGSLSGIAFPAPNADNDLVISVCEVLTATDSCCMMENYLATPGDPWLQRAKSRIATYDLDVYHELTHDDGNETAVGQAIREARHLPTFVGAIGKMSGVERTHLPRQRAVTLEELRVFAHSVRFLFVLAYDGEGYLCWQGGADRRLQRGSISRLRVPLKAANIN